MSASVVSTVVSSPTYEYWRQQFSAEQAVNIEELLIPFYHKRKPSDIVLRTDKLIERVNAVLGNEPQTPVHMFEWQHASEAQALARHRLDRHLFMGYTFEKRRMLKRKKIRVIQSGLTEFVGALDELPLLPPGTAAVVATMVNKSLAEALLACVASFIAVDDQIRKRLAPFFQLRKDGCLLCAITERKEGVVMLGLPA